MEQALYAYAFGFFSVCVCFTVLVIFFTNFYKKYADSLVESRSTATQQQFNAVISTIDDFVAAQQRLEENVKNSFGARDATIQHLSKRVSDDHKDLLDSLDKKLDSFNLAHKATEGFAKALTLRVEQLSLQSKNDVGELRLSFGSLIETLKEENILPGRKNGRKQTKKVPVQRDQSRTKR